MDHAYQSSISNGYLFNLLGLFCSLHGLPLQFEIRLFTIFFNLLIQWPSVDCLHKCITVGFCWTGWFSFWQTLFSSACRGMTVEREMCSRCGSLLGVGNRFLLLILRLFLFQFDFHFFAYLPSDLFHTLLDQSLNTRRVVGRRLKECRVILTPLKSQIILIEQMPRFVNLFDTLMKIDVFIVDTRRFRFQRRRWNEIVQILIEGCVGFGQCISSVWRRGSRNETIGHDRCRSRNGSKWSRIRRIRR